jgi:dipeptidyl aminopeptidase/acylaminoacyl peptidase
MGFDTGSDGLAAPPARRPLSMADLARLVSLEEVALSPDGRHAAVVLETVDEPRNRVKHRLVVLEVDRPGRRRTIATGGPKLGSARWSPDGRLLAFVSDRTKPAQLWVRAMDGSAAPTRVTDHPRGVSSPAWSPDGTMLAFVAAGADIAGHGVPPEETDPRRRVIRVRGHRHKLEGTGYLDGPLAHLWVVGAGGGLARQLTDGRADDGGPAWSPDGREIAFTSDRSPQRDRHFGGNAIHVVDVATRAVRRLTREDRFASLPSWSPDGTSLAYLRAETTNDVDGHHDRLWVVDRDGREERCLTPDRDRGLGFRPGGYRTPSAPAWTPDGGAILQIEADAGVTQLVRIATGTLNAVERLTRGSHVIHEFSPDRAVGRVVFAGSNPVTPPELWALEAGRAEPWRVTGFNDRLVSAVALSDPRRTHVDRGPGFRIEGRLTLPPPGAPARAGTRGLPLMLIVHGGPHNAFGETFYPDIQLAAAAGYAVLAVNPRGSGSYDEAFARALVGDWGGEDFTDLMAALDATVAAADPPIDPGRLAIAGGSYGGFMSCWAITQTDRFAVALAGASITNLETEYGTADIGPSWLHDEQQGNPREREAAYRARSPIRFVERVRTPVLLYHGEADLRCPIEQSEQFFTALTELGRDVELIRVPGEGHVLPADATPVHRRVVREAILEWLERFVGAPRGA